MHFEFTVRLDDGDHDVLVRTPRPLRLGEVWPRLLALLDSPAHVRPHVEPGVVLGSRQLPTGAVIRCADERGHDGGDGRSAHDPAGNLAAHVVGGRDAGATAPLRPGSTRIGRDPHSAIVLHDERVSRQHVTMHLDSTGISLHDDTSTNGTTIEGVPLGPDGSPLATGAIARIGDTLLAVHRGDETPLPIVSFGNRQQVTPVPRRPHPPPTVLDVAGRSRRAGPRPTQWLAALIPALAAGALAWLLHSPTFLLFALLSPAMLLGTAFGDRLHLRRSRRSDDVTRRVRDASDEQAVATALRAETAARRARHPDPVVIGRAATVPTTTLWQRRRPDDDDVLTLRIGSAELTSSARVRRDGSTEPAGRLTAVPMTIDLRDGPVGVIGPPDVLDGLARCLVTQLAVLHPPSTVELALFLADQAGEARWRWARWLPHLGERVARSSGQCRDLAEQLSAPTGDRWTVAVIDRAVGAAQFAQPALFDQPAQSSDRGAPIRRTALVFGDSLTDLPPWCVGTLDLWADRGGGDTGEPVIDQTGEPVIDQVGEGWAEAVARALAPLSDAAGVGPTPERCALLDLLDVEGPTVAELLERWAASTGRADTALGTTADGRLELDLERDGPHVLVAGTTGSGKSELLRTLVLGLALQHPPDELSFVLVDYKGGAAFAECAGLPHVLGSVTDLDAHLTRRALHSLDAELRRRERLLAAAGASDLDGYRRTATQPLARLVIVVDEFAALADTLPDFLSGLVSVAQRGRSLGVHLVLATQRPGTAVTPEIRANTACRIALRVIEAAESSDIIGVPDAAALSSRRPGRALLSGDGAPVEFQTARVEGIDRARVSEVTVERLGPWRGRQSIGAVTSRSETSCAQIVEVVRRAAAERGVAPGVGPWSAPLPALLAAGSLPSSGAQLVPFGLVDRPSEQRQDILALDLDLPSSWLVVGGPRSGRTTTLLSVVLAAAAASSPADLEIYVIDGAGPLATVLNGLPHVATCLGPDELMAAGPLLRRLAARGTGTARVLLVIDQGERVLTGDEHATGTVCTSELNVLLGVHRVTVLTAGSLALLMPRVVSGFEHKAVLRLQDRADYALAGIPGRDVPALLPPGRAVRVADGALLQLAFPGATPGVLGAAATVPAVVDRWRAHRSSAAVRIRALPRALDLAALPRHPTGLRLGVAGESAEPVHVDPLGRALRWLVAGPARSGRTTTLLTLLSEACRLGVPVLVAAPGRSALLARATECNVPALDPTTLVPGEPPEAPTLVLVDDCESIAGSPLDDMLTRWARDSSTLSFVVTGRSDELAAAYRGLAAEMRRARSGLLLRPGPLDGDLFDVRLPRRADGPPGRGVLVGEPGWSPDPVDPAAPVAVQVARP